MNRARLVLLLFVVLSLSLAACSDTTALPIASPTQPSASISNPVQADSSNQTLYVVQPADTLTRIAAQHKTTVELLIEINKNKYPSITTNPTKLRPGWELILPPSSNTDVQVAAQALAATPVPPTAAPAKLKPSFDRLQTEAQVVQVVNQVRAQAGLPLLVVDPALAEIARLRSQDIIARNYLGHTDPVTGEPLAKKLFDQRGYRNYTAGENLAIIQNEVSGIPGPFTVATRYDPLSAAQEFLTGWFNSPTHRDNILHPEFSKTGVGVAVSEDGTRIAVTQIFMN